MFYFYCGGSEQSSRYAKQHTITHNNNLDFNTCSWKHDNPRKRLTPVRAWPTSGDKSRLGQNSHFPNSLLGESGLHPSHAGAEDCTPEVDTSEFIVDSGGICQWTLSGMLRCMLSCPAALPTGLSFLQWMLAWHCAAINNTINDNIE